MSGKAAGPFPRSLRPRLFLWRYAEGESEEAQATGEKVGASPGSVWGGTCDGEGTHHERIVRPCASYATFGDYSLAACCRPTPAALHCSLGCEIARRLFGGTESVGKARHFGRAFFLSAASEARNNSTSIRLPLCHRLLRLCRSNKVAFKRLLSTPASGEL